MQKGRQSAAPAPENDDFATSVLEGLSRPGKSLPCRFFYDAEGNALFEEITKQPEYYLTNGEVAVLEANTAQILEDAADDMVLVEFGSGSSLKTEILLRRTRRLYAYAPIDISVSALLDAKQRLKARFPWLDVRPLLADFSCGVSLPPELAMRPKLGFFPGSTIGNFSPPEAVRLLVAMRKTLSPGARLVIGVDLKKDARRLVAAYDDAKGVTAAFNLNLLARINRELDGDFDLRRFRHEAVYDEIEGRIEMRLVSIGNQRVRVANRIFSFRDGEAIHTENAYKYSVEAFQRVAREAGWRPLHVWTDKENVFSVHELVDALS